MQEPSASVCSCLHSRPQGQQRTKKTSKCTFSSNGKGGRECLSVLLPRHGGKLIEKVGCGHVGHGASCVLLGKGFHYACRNRAA